MAYEDLVKLGEAMEKKWNEQNPGVKMPEVNSEEFNIFCDELLAEAKIDSAKNENNSKKETQNVYEDNKYRYTKIDRNYIHKVMNDWIDENPGKAIGITLLAGIILSCKVFQHICSRAVYKGNLRTIKYWMKHYK